MRNTAPKESKDPRIESNTNGWREKRNPTKNKVKKAGNKSLKFNITEARKEIVSKKDQITERLNRLRLKMFLDLTMKTHL